MIQLPPYEPDSEDQQSAYDYTIALGEETYRIKLRAMSRQDRWYMHIYDSDDNLLIAGVKLTVGIPWLIDLQIAGLPEGELFLLDTSGSDAEGGFDDLGNRVELLYIEPDEIPEEEESGISVTVEAA